MTTMYQKLWDANQLLKKGKAGGAGGAAGPLHRALPCVHAAPRCVEPEGR